MTRDFGLHRANQGFSWHRRRVKLRQITPDQAEAYHRRGYFVLREAFDGAEIDALTAELDPLAEAANEALRAADEGPGISKPDRITFRPHAVKVSEVARAFSRHPVITGLVHDLVGDDVRLYWDQLVYKHPGMAEEFPWHQDNGYTFIEPQQYLTCWVALTPATLDNGCPWVVPGWHLGGTLRHRWTALGFECLQGVDNAEPLPLEAGDVAVFSSLTPHRTGPNLTQAIRKAYILQYAADGTTIYPRGGSPMAADAPGRQYWVLKNGEPCRD